MADQACMFTHIMVGARDLGQSMPFYDATMQALGIARASASATRLYYANGGPPFIVTLPRDGAPATHANGGTIGLLATSPAMVDAWHAAGLANGGTDEGAPGPREEAPGVYIAYLRDPSGNKICVHCRI